MVLLDGPQPWTVKYSQIRTYNSVTQNLYYVSFWGQVDLVHSISHTIPGAFPTSKVILHVPKATFHYKGLVHQRMSTTYLPPSWPHHSSFMWWVNKMAPCHHFGLRPTRLWGLSDKQDLIYRLHPRPDSRDGAQVFNLGRIGFIFLYLSWRALESALCLTSPLRSVHHGWRYGTRGIGLSFTRVYKPLHHNKVLINWPLWFQRSLHIW